MRAAEDKREDAKRYFYRRGFAIFSFSRDVNVNSKGQKECSFTKAARRFRGRFCEKEVMGEILSRADTFCFAKVKRREDTTRRNFS